MFFPNPQPLIPNPYLIMRPQQSARVAAHFEVAASLRADLVMLATTDLLIKPHTRAMVSIRPTSLSVQLRQGPIRHQFHFRFMKWRHPDMQAASPAA